jgi:hypothetical protein
MAWRSVKKNTGTTFPDGFSFYIFDGHMKGNCHNTSEIFLCLCFSVCLAASVQHDECHMTHYSVQAFKYMFFHLIARVKMVIKMVQ